MMLSKAARQLGPVGQQGTQENSDIWTLCFFIPQTYLTCTVSFTLHQCILGLLCALPFDPIPQHTVVSLCDI